MLKAMDRNTAEKMTKDECLNVADISAETGPPIGTSQCAIISPFPSLDIAKYFLQPIIKDQKYNRKSVPENTLLKRTFIIKDRDLARPITPAPTNLEEKQIKHTNNGISLMGMQDYLRAEDNGIDLDIMNRLHKLREMIDDLSLSLSSGQLNTSVISRGHREREGPIEQLFDPFRFLKYELANTYHIQNISTGWLRLWEVLSEFDLVPLSLLCESFISFHSGSFPETSILALHHYVKTKTNLKSHVWFASAEQKADDPYELRGRYSSHWVDQSVSHTGGKIEALNKAQMGHVFGVKIFNTFPDKIHLYISEDIDPSGDQEVLFHQITHGFSLLRKGGNMIIKLCAFFNSTTQVLISLCVRHFAKVFITKPITSKILNDESYLVCISFDLELSMEESPYSPSFDSSTFDGTMVVSTLPHISGSLEIALTGIYNATINGLEQALELSKLLNEVKSVDETDSTNKLKLLRHEAGSIHKCITSVWVQNFGIKSLKLKDKLNCKEQTRTRKEHEPFI
jgi:hypothetical protein